MIVSTTKNENTLHFQNRSVLEDVLKKKSKDFVENFFPTYEYSLKCSYIKKNDIKHLNLFGYLLGSTSIFMILGVGLINELLFGNLIVSTFYMVLQAFFTFYFVLPFNQKIALNKFLTKNINIEYLKSEMFLDYVVDKETMRAFAKSYSEEELVNLMLEKQNLKYRDILFYIEEEQKRIGLKDEKQRLTNAVKCLVEQG